MRFLPLTAMLVLVSAPALAEPASSVTQYGITWSFDGEYEVGQFATGDFWVVGPVTITSVSPGPTDGRNGSAVDPRGGRQGYDDRGGEYSTEDRVEFPLTLAADHSLVSSISKPEGVEVRNAGALVAQAVLTVVGAPPPAGTFRPSYAGTYKRYHHTADIEWSALPSLPAPGSAPDGDDVALLRAAAHRSPELLDDPGQLRRGELVQRRR